MAIPSAGSGQALAMTAHVQDARATSCAMAILAMTAHGRDAPATAGETPMNRGRLPALPPDSWPLPPTTYHHHSYLSAAIGSTFMARRAGRKPARSLSEIRLLKSYLFPTLGLLSRMLGL